MSRQLALIASLLITTPLAHAETGAEGTPSTPAAPETPATATAPSPAEPMLVPPSVPVAPPATPGASDELTLEEWKRDDWMLVRPELSLFEVDGYLRIRGDIFRRLDFDNDVTWEDVPGYDPDGDGHNGYPRYLETSNGHANVTSTNMRLRLVPTLNVTETAQVVMTVDVFDNLVLGSTPTTYPHSGPSTPTNLLASGQRSLGDSIVVKRAYARLAALNEQLVVTAGRMPDHWGLGMLVNSGDCLDCDYGNTVDRVGVTFKAANHFFMPSVDWISNGPVATPFTSAGGQPIDAVTWDDVPQYQLRVMRLDDPEDIKERVLQGQTVINYGLMNALRRQSRDLPGTYAGYADAATGTSFDPTAPVPTSGNRDERRDATLYTGDAYFQLFAGKLELSLEIATMLGKFTDTVVTGTSQETTLAQFGGVFDLKYKVEGEKRGPVVGMHAGAASGDDAPGFGALDLSGTQRRARAVGAADTTLNNFQFSPDYHVDLLLFRRILGTVTDAWFVGPDVAYQFDNGVVGKLSANYAQAMFKESTPGDSAPMGLEFDSELLLGSVEDDGRGGVQASLAGGLLFPFGAFKNLLKEEAEQSGSFAWTMQARLYVSF